MACRNPFFIRSSLFLINCYNSFFPHVRRNPFFIRSSLFRSRVLRLPQDLVAIPFLSGLLCFAFINKLSLEEISRNPFFIRSSLFHAILEDYQTTWSQSLFYQVFFVSAVQAACMQLLLVAIPFLSGLLCFKL